MYRIFGDEFSKNKGICAKCVIYNCKSYWNLIYMQNNTIITIDNQILNMKQIKHYMLLEEKWNENN